MIPILLSIALIVGLDQFTKYLTIQYIAPKGAIDFIPGFMEFRYVLNNGASFNILAGKQEFLVVFTGIALLIMIYMLIAKKFDTKWEYISVTMIAGGGIGNLIDRIFRGEELFNGHVVDMLSTQFIDFPVFNVADSFVCVGVAVLLLAVVIDEYSKYKNKKSESENNG